MQNQVLNTSGRILKELTGFNDEYLNSLIKFYSSKRFSAVTILSWTETLDFLKNKPDITTEEILEIKELNPSILETKTEPEAKTKHKHSKKSKKSKKNKEKKEKKEKKHKEKNVQTAEGKTEAQGIE